jgi:CheY-like chemotaxis protein
MVVDDNPINRIVTRRLLDTIGCKSTVLESGQKCLDILTEKGPREFQIILLDLCMPEVRYSFRFQISNTLSTNQSIQLNDDNC